MKAGVVFTHLLRCLNSSLSARRVELSLPSVFCNSRALFLSKLRVSEIRRNTSRTIEPRVRLGYQLNKPLVPREYPSIAMWDPDLTTGGRKTRQDHCMLLFIHISLVWMASSDPVSRESVAIQRAAVVQPGSALSSQIISPENRNPASSSRSKATARTTPIFFVPRGEEVSVESFLRLLTGRTLPGTPPSKVIRLQEATPHLSYISSPVCVVLVHVFFRSMHPPLTEPTIYNPTMLRFGCSHLSLRFCLYWACIAVCCSPFTRPSLRSSLFRNPLDNVSCGHLVQTLTTDEHSNVLIYMNGHGGDQFLKFHDMEEVSSHDLGGALREMELKKRYHRVRVL